MSTEMTQAKTCGHQMEIIFSAGGQFYAVPDVRRECGLWLSTATHPLPVPVEWHRPGAVCACVARGRNYYRIGIFGPQRNEISRTVDADSELARDYRDAAWWTPGLEEAWTQIDALSRDWAQLAEAPVSRSSEAAVRKAEGEAMDQAAARGPQAKAYSQSSGRRR
jgi:hypothetical protein